jgi:DNA adenine methylase
VEELNITEAKKINGKVRPVIKWTGGKYEEFSMFSQFIPAFERYFEPFFGGGGVFFALQPRTPAFLNDKSSDLIKFYSLIHSKGLQEELFTYCDAWDEAGNLSDELKQFLLPVFKKFIFNVIDTVTLKKELEKIVSEIAENSNHLLFKPAFILFPEKFIQKLNASILDKCTRIKDICLKGNRRFDDNELHDHIETGIKSGLYLFLRHLLNMQYAGTLQMSDSKAVANWYFVREFCYASMFRFNRKGGFNIPYGGIAYNRKNFRAKVENIFSKEVKHTFQNSHFYNLDFAHFLSQTRPQKNDFIFLDPPYDSDFSEYDQNSFTKDDQVRLRDVLLQTEAKWMLVIKETDFIRSLYAAPQCNFIEFDKTYTYNVRGRNNRDTRHLIIVNYTI